MIVYALVALSVATLIALACHDRLQTVHPLLRVYPVVGRCYWLVQALRRLSHADRDVGYPFTVDQLERIRGRALTGSVSSSFGAPVPLDGVSTTDVAIMPTAVPPLKKIQVQRINGSGLAELPILNFGAVGVGPVSINTVRGIAVAARSVDCLQHTSELGLNTVNLNGGAGLIWQIGPGYWGCRDRNGRFDKDRFESAASASAVKLIELKLGQGARAGGEGFFPASKNTKRVGQILGVEPHTPVRSPPQHSAFDTLEGALEFISDLDEAAGKPVGIKICVGSRSAVDSLVSALSNTGIVPSFITVDGGEGGTGSGPYELQQYAGVSASRAIDWVHSALSDAGVRSRTRIFAAGRIESGYELFLYLCRGADAGFFTRAPMVAMGCVQARKCHVGTCPTGIATEHRWRRGAIDPQRQGSQLAAYYRTVIEGFEHLRRASGRSVEELDQSCIVDPEMA